MLQLLMAPLANDDASGIAMQVQEIGIPHDLLGDSDDIGRDSESSAFNPVGEILFSLIESYGSKDTLHHLLHGFWYNPRSECLPMVSSRSLDDLCRAFRIAIEADNYDSNEEMDDGSSRYYSKDEMVTILYNRIIVLSQPQLPCCSPGVIAGGVPDNWFRKSEKVRRNVEAIKGCWLGITINNVKTIQTFLIEGWPYETRLIDLIGNLID